MLIKIDFLFFKNHIRSYSSIVALILNIMIVQIDLETTLPYRVGLAQLVRFLVMKLIYLSSNSRFDIGVTFMTNYSFN
jgi:hypothetical protein